MRILITGSRKIPYELTNIVENALSVAWVEADDDTTLVHGDCPRPLIQPINPHDKPYRIDDRWNSVDQIANQFAFRARIPQDKYPVTANDWLNIGKKAGPLRNLAMVKTLNPETDICLAFPYGESRGTRGCIKLAQQRDIPVFTFELE